MSKKLKGTEINQTVEELVKGVVSSMVANNDDSKATDTDADLDKSVDASADQDKNLDKSKDTDADNKSTDGDDKDLAKYVTTDQLTATLTEFAKTITTSVVEKINIAKSADADADGDTASDKDKDLDKSADTDVDSDAELNKSQGNDEPKALTEDEVVSCVTETLEKHLGSGRKSLVYSGDKLLKSADEVDGAVEVNLDTVSSEDWKNVPEKVQKSALTNHFRSVLS